MRTKRENKSRHRNTLSGLKKAGLGIAIAALAVITIPRPAQAATLTWDGGGIDNNWSTCANWTTDVCPVAGDTVTFNATSTKDAVVDAGFEGAVTSVALSAGYTGTISLARSLSTSGTFTQSAGTFTASDQSLSIGSTFTLNAGANFMASSVTTTFSSTFTINGGTFSHNSGTVNFAGASATLSCNNVSFNLVTFNNTGTKTVNSTCSLPLGTNPSIPAAVTLTGTLSGSGTLTLTNGLHTYNTGAVLSGFSGLVSGGTVTISGATLNFSGYTTLDLNGPLTMSAGSFTAPIAIMTVAGSLTITGGTFDANGGTVTFDGSTATLACNNVSFNLVTFNNTGTKTVNSTCSLPLGTNPSIPAAVTLSGTLSGSGALTTAGTQTYNAGATLSGFSGYVAAGSVVISGAALNFSSYTTLDLNSALTMSAGSFTAPSVTMTLAGSLTITGGTFNANGGTVMFDGSTATLACNNVSFNLVTFNNTGTKTVNSNCSLPLGLNPTIPGGMTLSGTLSGSGTLTTTASAQTYNAGATLSGFSGFVAGGSIVVSGATIDFGSYTTVDLNSALTISSGSFTAPSGTMTLAGAFTSTGGTFNANNGTVTFDGSSATLSCNNANFSHVIFAHTAGTKTVSINCSLPLGTNPSIPFAIILNGTLSGDGMLTTGSVQVYNATAVLSGFSGLSAAAISINGATLDFSSYTSMTLSNLFTQTGGTVIMPNEGATFNHTVTLNSGAMMSAANSTFIDINRTLLVNSGATFIAPAAFMSVAWDFQLMPGSTFNANGGTLIFDTNFMGLLLTRLCNNTTFSKVIFANLPDTFVGFGSDCSFPLGHNPILGAGGNVVANGGTLSGTGTLATDLDSLTLNAGTLLTGFTGLSASNDLTLDAATANLGAYNTLDINGNLVLQNSATLTATSANTTLGGNLTVNAGSTFNANNGTVVLDGSDQTIVGALTFHNLTKTVATAATLTFPASTTQTITGALTLQGATGQLLSLVSSTPGIQWQLNPQGTRDVNFASVTDSQNSNSTAIMACNSTDSGNNLNWNFNPIACIPIVPPVDGEPSGGSGGSPLAAGGIISILKTSLQGYASSNETALADVPLSSPIPASTSGTDQNSTTQESSTAEPPPSKTTAKGSNTRWFWLLGLFVVGGSVIWFLGWRKHRRDR